MILRSITLLITIYQLVVSLLFKHLLGVSSFCRFTPSCSAYTKKQLQTYGIIRGGINALTRLAHCHPLRKAQYV